MNVKGEEMPYNLTDYRSWGNKNLNLNLKSINETNTGEKLKAIIKIA